MEHSKLFDIFEMFWNKILQWLPEVFTAIIVLLIGIWTIRFVAKRMRKTRAYGTFEPSIAHFAVTTMKIVLYVILFLVIASLMGIPMTSFIAILGSIGIAIGLAMQSHLSNIAAGIEILILKPLKDGDTVQIQNFIGTVKKVRLYFTILNTVDNRQVIVPNNLILSQPLINFTQEEMRKLDLIIGISYDSSIQEARNIILSILEKDTRILKEPELPSVSVNELAESSIDLVVRAWTSTADYQQVKWDFLEEIKIKFDEFGIKIPFPQREIHHIHSYTGENITSTEVE